MGKVAYRVGKTDNSSGIIAISLSLRWLHLWVSKAASLDKTFFSDADAFFKTQVKNGLVDYASAKSSAQLSKLISTIAKADLSQSDDKTKQAFYVNAYNLHVINKVASAYPLRSVMDKAGFFDSDKVEVAGEQLTLNKLEKEKLLKIYNDARYHFVLVCGAVGCPPITDFAYTPEKLEAQLEQQTRIALNNDDFLKSGNGTIELSQIFKWYANDFGGSKSNIITFLNKYRNDKIDSSNKIKYYNYDWLLNDQAGSQGGIGGSNTNDSRYIVSSTIQKGTVELKIFNNLYSQQTGDGSRLTSRSSFFTSSLSALYGLTDRVNVGINTRFRKVRNNDLPSSPFSVFEDAGESGSSRRGLTALGPQIRFAPVPKWQNFSIQSSFVFPIGNNLAGNNTTPYIDWNGATWNTQFFNDFSIGSKFSLFTEVDLLLEDIGKTEQGHQNRLSTPVTAIFSYVPTNELTIYALGGYSPYWQADFDYFIQFGIGSKYQFTPNFELEVLYTDFSNKFLNDTGGKAETINLGLRININ